MVNFESVNALGQGRYYDGLVPQCAAREDFTQALGTGTEPLLAVALKHADGGGCAAAATSARPRALSAALQRALVKEGTRPAMIAR